MSTNPSDPVGESARSVDDTAAFQRFYFGEESKPRPKSLMYRIFVGWWKDRD